MLKLSFIGKGVKLSYTAILILDFVLNNLTCWGLAVIPPG